MQHSPLQLRQKLIDTVDDKYHVKDLDAIVEVLGTLERLPVTKDILESTRLGKTVNEFRRKVNNDYLAKRAKALVKKWRETILLPDLPDETSQSSQQPTPLEQQYSPSSRPHNGNATYGQSQSKWPSLHSETLTLGQLLTSMTQLGFFTTDEQSRDAGLFGADYDESLHDRLLPTEGGDLVQEDDDVDSSTRQIIDVDTLHTQQVPNVNGNLDPTTGQFHEWHETYSVQSTSGDLLHILPYTVIDF